MSAPDPPAAASRVFGDRLELTRRYATALASAGVERGLIGPREVDRLWDRHLLNCAVVAERIDAGARVVDIGSGAGLPGLPLALARPDLTVILVEPLARRVAFLTEVIADLDLSGVRVVRGRAEEPAVRRQVGPVDVVTARAVAGLDVLARHCLPLLRPGGRLLAIKGVSAADEIGRSRADVRRYGGTTIELVRCGVDVVAVPTTVVEISRGSGSK